MTAIVRDEAIRSGSPRIEGTRITVLDVKRRIIDGAEDPFAVAGEYDVDVAGVFAALAYYYDHVDAMRECEAERDRRLREGERRSARRRAALEADEPVEQ